ncbi:MAG: adenosylcobinamide-GDP ribazoletransferase [Bacteroidales bacterium]|nr:adenosylcobinamide-GDP ribazoletransferase [Bacteroidales bacterium]
MRNLLNALMLYTRIPVPAPKDFEAKDINRAMRYFVFVGWVVGAICALVFILGKLVFGIGPGVVLALAAGVLATGAFHEDGFADTLDGFGGGRGDRPKILDIMKDSHIGTYGVVGLIILFALKAVALYSILTAKPFLSNWAALIVFMLYHSVARFSSALVAISSLYVRTDGTGKLQPDKNSWSTNEAMGVIFWVIPPVVAAAAYFKTSDLWFVLLPVVIMIPILCCRGFFNKRLGGYTGDCLGFVEQLSEVLVLLYLIIVINFGFSIC